VDAKAVKDRPGVKDQPDTLRDLPHHPVSADTTHPCERTRTLTSEQALTSLVGWLISAIFKYIPTLRPRFDLLDGLWKRLIIISASLIVSAAVFALKCGGLNLPILEPCTQAGVIAFASIALTVAINTQAAYLLLPPIQPKERPAFMSVFDDDTTNYTETPARRTARV